MKRVILAIAALILFLVLLMPLRPKPSLTERLPRETEMLVQVHDPMRSLRKLAGTQALNLWLEQSENPIAGELLSRLKDPSMTEAFLLGALRMVHLVRGNISTDDGLQSFQILGLDVAFLPVLSRLITKLPGVEERGGMLHFQKSALYFQGDIAWLGDDISIQLLLDVENGKKKSVSQDNIFANLIMENRVANADASVLFFSHYPLTSALRFLKPDIRTSTMLDPFSFGGATWNITMDSNGIDISGPLIQQPARHFVKTCASLPGEFEIQHRLGKFPSIYLGLRVANTDRLADLVQDSFPELSGSKKKGAGLLKKTMLRSFAKSLGAESVLYLKPDTEGASAVAFQVKDEEELQRYLRALDRLLVGIGSEKAPEEGVFSFGEKSIYHKTEKGLFAMAMSRVELDRFLDQYTDESLADNDPFSEMETLRQDGCLLGYTDLTPALSALPAFQWATPMEPKAGVSLAEDGNILQIAAKVSLDNPITPVSSGAFTLARGFYLGIALLYLVLLIGSGILAGRNIFRLFRNRKSSAAKEPE